MSNMKIVVVKYGVLILSLILTLIVSCGGKAVTVSWTAPATRTDGSFLTLSEIGGYKIHYHNILSPLGEALVVDIDSSVITEYTTPTLTKGTYRFHMATYDSDELLGPLSPHTEITIR